VHLKFLLGYKIAPGPARPSKDVDFKIIRATDASEHRSIHSFEWTTSTTQRGTRTSRVFKDQWQWRTKRANLTLIRMLRRSVVYELDQNRGVCEYFEAHRQFQLMSFQWLPFVFRANPLPGRSTCSSDLVCLATHRMPRALH
jgi:hypothetical protein